jgi:hypothetical protein
MAGPSGNESNHVFNGATIIGGLAVVGDAGATTYLNRDAVAHTARQVALMRAQGYYAESSPLNAVANLQTTTGTGVVLYSPIGLLAGDVVSSMQLRCSTLGSGFSGIGMKVGLYSSASALLASSADCSTAFGSTGVKTVAMTTPYTITADGAYYCAVLAIASTTPTLIRANVAAAACGIATGGVVSPGGQQTGQTDLPAAATITFNSGNVFWFGVA